MSRWKTNIVLLHITQISFIYHFCLVLVKAKAYNNMEMRMDTLLTPSETVKPHNCECGKLHQKVDDERLLKVKIPGGRLPWLAELTTLSNGEPLEVDESEAYQLCFGTLVSLQTVLFPASCIHRNFYSNVARLKPKVKILGIFNRTASLYDISHVRVHPGYRKKFDNDLAIVKLTKKIDVETTGVVPVCLPPSTKSYPIPYPQIKQEEKETEKEAEIEFEKVSTNEIEMTTISGGKDVVTKAKPLKPTYVLEYSVLRTWFYRKSVGYDYIQYFGRFSSQITNTSACQLLFPEMLKSKVQCIEQRKIKEIERQNEYFFQNVELGMPLLLSNTTLVKGKPQSATTKYYIESLRAPGHNGLPLLESRNNTISLLKIEDYVPWIRETSGTENFCRM